MQWHLHDAAVKPRVLIMVSKFGHCLNDLLYRYRTGALPIVIPAIVSNHRDFYQLAASHDIPFHHLPVDPCSHVTAAARESMRGNLPATWRTIGLRWRSYGTENASSQS